jgi:DNA-binding PadR family transcriptional regulator
MKKSALRGNLDLLLLGILARGPAHGYEIIASLRDSSDGDFDLPEGTVYPALHKLESADLILSTWDDSGPRPRRVYEISDRGSKHLAAARAEWEQHVRHVNYILGAS